MATLGRRLIYDFPQYYNIFGRNSTSAGIKTVQNTNKRLLDAYAGADGIKTGYTRAAGFNLVSSAQRGNKRVIVAMLGGRTSASRNAEVARLMDLGFSKMPAQARFAALQPIHVLTAAADAAPAGGTATLASASGVRARAIVVAGDLRPMPRSAAGGGAGIARSQASIAAAIEEVNAELAAAQAERGPALAGLAGRPAPGPGSDRVEIAAGPGSASTFAVAPAAPRPSPEPEQTIEVANSGTGSTGGNDWGIQIGAFRAKGDAERQLLTTALKDVPELNGGLRRVEAAKVQGVTVYRAQFVGLSRTEAMGACEALNRQDTDCLPLAPGI
jgi:D-alanyl-D-alanine carboxypeptidase